MKKEKRKKKKEKKVPEEKIVVLTPPVLAQYLFKANGHAPTSWQLKGVALAGYTVAFASEFFQ